MNEKTMSCDNRSQTVGLGCGTLIAIGLIVFFLGNRGTKDVQRELQAVRAEMAKIEASAGRRETPITTSVEAPLGPNLDLDRLQSELREMRKTLEAQTERLKSLEEKLDRLSPEAPREPAPNDPAR